LYRVVVVTRPSLADGFRLAGVDVRIAVDGEAAHKVLGQLLDDESSGIVVVDRMYTSAIDERMQRKIDASYRPVVVALPVREQLEQTESHSTYLSRLIRRAVGFDITPRRE
jgi:vacuolar-type H+-ATPase subunit F/Vma7